MSTDLLASRQFDLDTAWALNPQVSIRPERFGALLYHFGTRRLSFLKSPVLLTVVQSLAEHPTARAACAAAGVTNNPDGTDSGGSVAQFRAALATLAASDTIIERST